MTPATNGLEFINTEESRRPRPTNPRPPPRPPPTPDPSDEI